MKSPATLPRLKGTHAALRDRAVVFVLLLLVCAVTCIVLSPSLGGGFVQWDDDINILQNPHIRGLSLENLRWMFTDYAWTRRYQPLDWLSWGLTYQLFGLSPLAFHLGNLLEHLVSVALLYFLTLKLLRVLWRRGSEAQPTETLLALAAAAGTLCWAVHPLRAEPVAWATGRNYTQSAMFLLACFLAYVYSRDAAASALRRHLFYWLAVAAFICSLLSYAIVAGAAVALLILDVYPLGRLSLRPARGWWQGAKWVLLEKVPFFAAALAVGVITLEARWHASGIWAPPPTLAQFPLLARIMQAFYVWAYYAWIPFVPVDLSPVYTRLVSFNPNGAIFWCSLVFVVAMSAVAWRFRRRAPWLAAAWIYHLVILVPLLGFTEHPHYANDRYAHVHNFVLCLLVAGGVVMLWMRCRNGLILRFSAILIAALIVSESALCYAQTLIWHDSEGVFQYMLAELGDDPYRADIYQRLGLLYLRENRYKEAIATYRLAARALDQAAQEHPTAASLRSAGQAYAQGGEFPAALNRLELAEKLAPQDAGIELDLAQVLLVMGQKDAALQHLDRAVALDPQLQAQREAILAGWRAGPHPGGAAGTVP